MRISSLVRPHRVIVPGRQLDAADNWIGNELLAQSTQGSILGPECFWTDELQRRVDGELDRDERELVAEELSSGAGWTRALEAAQVGAPLSPPIVQAMLNLFAIVIPRRHRWRRARFMTLVHKR